MFHSKYLCCAVIWIILKFDCVATNESCPIYVELLPNKMIKILNEEELCRCLEFKPAEVLEKKLSCDLETSFSDGQIAISATSVCGCIGYDTDTKKILPKLLEINISERTSSESSVTRHESTIAKNHVEKDVTYLSPEKETPSYSEEEINDSTDVNESELTTLELPKFETNTTKYDSRNHFEITTELNDETKVSTHGESTLSSNVESTIIEDYTETPYLSVSVSDITVELIDSNGTKPDNFTSFSMLKNKIENESSQEGNTIPAIRKPTEKNDYDYYEKYGTIIVSFDEENKNRTDNIDKSSSTSLDSDKENGLLIETTENITSKYIKNVTKAYDLKITTKTNFVHESLDIKTKPDQYYNNTREYKSSTPFNMVNGTEKLDEQTTIGLLNAQRNQPIILANFEANYSDTESIEEFREPHFTELENRLKRTTSIHDELKDASGDGSYLYDDSDTEDVVTFETSKLAHRYLDTDDLVVIATASTVVDESHTEDFVGYYKYTSTDFTTKKGESREDDNSIRDIVFIVLGLLLATLVAVLIALYAYTSCFVKRGSYDLQPSASAVEMGSR